MATNNMSDAGSQTDILGDCEGCLSRSKPVHTKLTYWDLFNNPGLQNDGGIDLAECLWMLEEPSQLDANNVVRYSYSSSVRSRCPPAQGRYAGANSCVGGGEPCFPSSEQSP